MAFDAAAARALYDDGYGCRAIAKKLGCAASTVSAWAKDAGLAFDRSQTDMATRAHVVDMAETRLLLAQKMAVAAHDMLDALDGPYLVYAFGGRDNEYREHTLDRAPVEVVRNAVTTAGIAFDKATKVLELTPEGRGEAESLLDRLEQDLEADLTEADDAEFGKIP